MTVIKSTLTTVTLLALISSGCTTWQAVIAAFVICGGLEPDKAAPATASTGDY